VPVRASSYPVRFGPLDETQRYVTAWARQESGSIDRKAPLDRFYSEASIASLGDGIRSFTRGAPRRGAALVGALRQTIRSCALAAETRGEGGFGRGRSGAQTAVEKLSRETG
jgi:hypothetical protein